MIDAYVGIPGSGKTYMLVNRGLRDWLHGYMKARTRHHVLLRASGNWSTTDMAANMPPVTEYKALHSNFELDLPSLVRFLCIRRRLDIREATVLAASVGTLRTYQDLLNCFNAIILLAEAQLWFNSRDFAYFPTEVLAFWTQSRHAGVDIYFDTQKYEMVDTNIRGLVANLYRARPMPFTFRMMQLLGAKTGVIDRKHAKLPVFRYTTYMDDASGEVSKKAKGIMEGVGRNDFARLDPLLAAIYQTYGKTYAPAKELHAALGTQKSKISDVLGLTFDLTAFHRATTPPTPSHPGVTVREAAQAILARVPVAELVRQREAQHDAASRGAERVPVAQLVRQLPDRDGVCSQ